MDIHFYCKDCRHWFTRTFYNILGTGRLVGLKVRCPRCKRSVQFRWV